MQNDTKTSQPRKKVDNVNRVSATLCYPLNIGEGSFSSCIMFSQFTRNKSIGTSPGVTIVLYMPEKASNPSTTDWDSQAKGGAAGNAISQVLSNNNNANMSAQDTFLQAAGSIAGSIARAGLDTGGKVLYDNVLGGGNKSGISVDLSFEDAMSLATKTIPNPYLQMLFKGVNFRNFDFSFKMFPHSEKEAKVIHEIIKTFRASAYPHAGSADSASLQYPPEFDIQYLFNGGTNNYLHKFKRSVLTKVDVDYTAEGTWTMLRDGFPSQIEVNLTFSEIIILVDTDILNGY